MGFFEGGIEIPASEPDVEEIEERGNDPVDQCRDGLVVDEGSDIFEDVGGWECPGKGVEDFWKCCNWIIDAQ